MIVLGVETSCDDTCAAIYDGSSILSNTVSTQLIHRNFGGVVPELASRSHIKLILPVIRQALEQASITIHQVEGIAVTYGPGLAGSLIVGLSTAKGMALSLNLPFIGINHLEGHIWGNRLVDAQLAPPFLVLIVSGGHTQLVHVRGWGDYYVLGRTRDDAAGEAFDKVGKLLKVGYPGGPAIEKLAREGNPMAIRFPRAFLEEGSLDFSFSGLKTAVLNYVQKLNKDQLQDQLRDIAAGFQEAVVDVLVTKTISAAKKVAVSNICLAGGVACNQRLQDRIKQAGNEAGIEVLWPPPMYSADNGAMIACAGHYWLSTGKRSPLHLSPVPSLNF